MQFYYGNRNSFILGQIIREVHTRLAAPFSLGLLEGSML